MRIYKKAISGRLLLPFLLLVFLPFSGCVQKKLAVEKGDQWFQIAVLPDTQYYTALRHGGTLEMFEQQIDYILQNYKKERILYVAHLGDITDHGEDFPVEWERANKMLSRLEQKLPGLPYGIPYGLAVGNHDTSPNGTPKRLKTGYEATFGRHRFKDRPYYGESLNKNNMNDNHYDLFSGGGQDFIVLYLAYNEPEKPTFDSLYQKEVFAWAGEVLKQHKNRKAIIVSHSILKKPSNSNSNYIPGKGYNSVESKFTGQGKAIYDFAKDYPNVFMTLSGHVSGEGYRIENYNGNTIKLYLSDYQSRRNPPYTENDRNGGNGTMRLMKFNLKDGTLSVRTLTPQTDGNHVWEEDDDSKFTHPLFK